MPGESWRRQWSLASPYAKASGLKTLFFLAAGADLIGPLAQGRVDKMHVAMRRCRFAVAEHLHAYVFSDIIVADPIGKVMGFHEFAFAHDARNIAVWVRSRTGD
jgi:hypothetical protein